MLIEADDFDDLAESRRRVVEFVVDQRQSIMGFWDQEAETFKHNVSETLPAGERLPVRHITTVHTCWESLFEQRRGLRSRSDVVERYAADVDSLEAFAAAALQSTDAGVWSSQESGFIYCRARTLGVLTRYAPRLLARHEEASRRLFDQVWTAQGASRLLGAYGVSETTHDPATAAEPEVPAYPANAYHTYWAATALARASAERYAPEAAARHLAAARDRLRLMLTEQVSYSAAGSGFTDAQQLAWAVAGVVYLARPTELAQDGSLHHVVRQGLTSFFELQEPDGTWSRGVPLFNYKRGSGNAYCYSFETLAELLTVASDPTVPEQGQFAAMLRPYAGALVRLLDHAEHTALRTSAGRGWVSGHSPNAVEAEAWATASVFRYAQRLRLLLGLWTNESARRDLGARKATKDGNDLRSRGATWDLGYGCAGTQLATNFALPAIAIRNIPTKFDDHFVDDPDDEVIGEGYGRSAVLFGPPGTGKTTLAEAVAGMLGWPFIEITPDTFLKEGLDMVSARADQVFRRMMELDRCVVLLDEIDELVQKRSGEAQQLARFFTTTMLPRLSKLWSAGKVLFFANTNNIVSVDPAIKRSGRFDAAIFVMPPGRRSKEDWLRAEDIEVEDSVWQAAESELDGGAGDGGVAVDGANGAGWLPLIRYDQLPSLAQAVRSLGQRSENAVINPGNVDAVLKDLRADLLTNDWSSALDGHNGDHPPERPEVVTPAFLLDKLRGSQRRELRLFPVVQFDGPELRDATRVAADAPYWRLAATPIDLDKHFSAPLRLHPDGSLEEQR